ncbi:MAG TPA: hypothetical protein VFZ61_32015 [Polyangiales bacterium]
MTGSTRWRLRTAATLAALALGACGGGEGGGGEQKDAGDNGSPTRDGSTPAPGMDGGAGFEVPVADLDDNVAGKPCTEDSQCSGTNAACVGSCTGACETDDNCGAGGTCVKALGGALGQYGACARKCSQKSDCSDGQDCREGVAAGDIFGDFLGAARDAGISLDDSGVDVSNLPKTCGPAFMTVDLPDGVVGKPCTMAAQCTPGACDRDINLLIQFPNGYCSGGCLSDGQCGKGGVCYKNPGAELLKLEGRCLLGCSGPSDCSNGLVCRSSQLLLESTPRNYCLPPVPDAGTPGPDASGPDAGAGADAGADAG